MHSDGPVAAANDHAESLLSVVRSPLKKILVILAVQSPAPHVASQRLQS